MTKPKPPKLTFKRNHDGTINLSINNFAMEETMDLIKRLQACVDEWIAINKWNARNQ